MTTDERFDRIEQYLLNLVQSVETLTKQFDRLEARMAALEARMDRLEARMAALETRMDRLEARMDGLETRIASLETRVGAVEKRTERLEQYVLDFRAEMIQRLNYIDARHQIVVPTVNSFESRLASLQTAVFEFGAGTSKMAADRMDESENFRQLVERVIRLEEFVATLKPAA